MKLAFVLPALFLIAINCQQASHYRNPFTGKCRNDEVQIGQADISTCSPGCDTQACPADHPRANGVTPLCLRKFSNGHRYCALKCDQNSQCPQGAKCYKMKNDSEEIEEATPRNRALQQMSYNICLYQRIHELPGDLELLEDN